MSAENPAAGYQAQWASCISQLESVATRDIRQLLQRDPERINNWLFEAAGLKIDLSRTPLNGQTLDILLNFARETGLEGKIKQLLAGADINTTENRAAHHTALRSFLEQDAHPHAVEAARAFARLVSVADDIRNGDWPSCNGDTISDVINIGIGGSDLGTRMACEAFASEARNGPNIHFAANIDPVALNSILARCRAQSTLVIVSSKSFSTLETLENARVARRWLLESMDETSVKRHLVAATGNRQAAIQWGIPDENILPLWDWVGGRYSIWSTVGLPIAIALGSEYFEQLLRGALLMDKHFAKTALGRNVPVLLALLDVLYVNVWGSSSMAVLPYSQQLARLPDYLQQLCMESNGKAVRIDGQSVESKTCPVIWGSAGTIGQHSFHQLLHQGTDIVPVDFILPLRKHAGENRRQDYLVANCLAQSQAFTHGKSANQAEQELLEQGLLAADAKSLAQHKAAPGNRPNTLIIMEQLTPGTLGALIAMYEHRVFVQSVLWDINAFDQWGVELGKQLCEPIYRALSGTDTEDQKSIDASSRYWIEQYKKGK